MPSNPFEIGVKRQATGDHYSDWLDEQSEKNKSSGKSSHLDGDEARKTHKKLLSWFYHERSKQAENRMEMAIDGDFYDNQQWDTEDEQVVRDRGQVPLVFNEVAPMVDWIIGTERRSRVDWKVLPRTEDDVEMADVKTKVLKYVADINRVSFERSRAFADAVKVGVGWLDDGACDDPTSDIIYSRYEDWRNVLWDSASYEPDLSDARYIFRWRWVDADVAEAMFPDRVGQLRRASVDTATTDEATMDGDWFQTEQFARGGSLYSDGAGAFGDASRNRIRLIECQYRMPAKVKIVKDGQFRGTFVNDHDQALMSAIAEQQATIIEKVMMRVHVAVFTETDLIAHGESTYRHNRFSLTPIWCYRKGRDRLPYGVIRRVRDIQQDLNKRASKALFLISTNQLVYEKGAFDDPNVAREEADQPDGMIERNPGKDVQFRRDADQTRGQMELMTLDAQTIQRSAGVNNENLGRATNAVSGEAIKARQLQGSVSTTEVFDNLRLGVQIQGEKQLSLAEQFYTEAKVVRLTGTRGKIEWVKVNQPEEQPDGSVRYLNDISASVADFVVSEQDYAGTLRQVMLEGITNMAQRLPPELAVRLFVIGMEFTDFPNKDELVAEMRRAIGERDPNKEPTPEEQQQAEQQAAMQAEAMDTQRQAVQLAMQEAQAKITKLNAEAEKLMAEAGVAAQKVQGELVSEVERLSDELRQAQVQAASRIAQINREADTKLAIANIDRETKLRIAGINAASSARVAALGTKINELSNRETNNGQP